MSTDFFERQDAARRSTTWLVVMFVLGVLGIVGGTMAVAWAVLEGASGYKAAGEGRVLDLPEMFGHLTPDDLVAMLAAGGASLALIGGGSLYKVAQLSGGGSVVAEGLGGKRVYPDSADAVERRLLNVVEEMALASGVPVPPVYMLQTESGINAFAAGYSPSDAIVAVTRGAAEQLSREELQGVVAHEFSHILNGDMRLNIRLIGVLHGLLLLGLIGRIMLRMISHSGRRSSDSKSGGGVAVVALIGLALFVLGYLGTLMGSLIKAAVSRQREYLADASAVQFTRNPGGLAGALKRIGARAIGSRIQAPNAAEASHLFFAQGVWEGLTSLTATHPPLEKRILALEPQWDGKFPTAETRPAVERELAGGTDPRRRGEQVAALAAGAVAAAAAGATMTDAAEVPLAVVKRAADQVGDPQELHRAYAARLIDALPPLVRDSAREPYGARAVLFGLLLDRDPGVREKQLATLAAYATKDVTALTVKLSPHLDMLEARMRLPLVDMSLPALRAMSPEQYRTFRQCFVELVKADNRLGLFEWVLHRVLLRHLQPQFEHTARTKVAYYGLQKLGRECSVLLSTLAHADNRLAEAPAALARGAAMLSGARVTLLDPAECGLEPLRGALDALARVAPKQRQSLVAACAATICADHEVTVAEGELLRGVCDMLDCPMPPLLPGQPVAA
ncbi:MAG: M48 family metallopeptidase [Pirellulales bacterium]|nr:M48 family metallopeptidase [Pirellulales bacterium]